MRTIGMSRFQWKVAVKTEVDGSPDREDIRASIHTLMEEFKGAHERRWNSEPPLVFLSTMLR